jgi:hypothetical protein
VPLRPPQIPHNLTRATGGGKPATNRLSYGTTLIVMLAHVIHITIPGFKGLRHIYFNYLLFNDPANNWDSVT